MAFAGLYLGPKAEEEPIGLRQAPEAVEVEKPKGKTWEELKADDTFIADAAYALEAIGTPVALDDVPTEEQRDTIAKQVLENHRFMTGNIISAKMVNSDVEKMSPDDRASWANVYKSLTDMPGIFSDGGAPVAGGIWDHARAIISDPTTIATLVAGGVTFGVGGVGTKVAGQAVKTGILNTIKSRALLALPASAIGGVSGYKRSTINQDTQIEGGTGRTEIDRGQAALMGALEGPGSLLAAAVVGKVVKESVKGLGRLADKNPTTRAGAEWMRNNLFPKGARDLEELRITERLAGEEKLANQKAVNAQKVLNNEIQVASKGMSVAEKTTLQNNVNKFYNAPMTPRETAVRLNNPNKIDLKAAREADIGAYNLPPKVADAMYAARDNIYNAQMWGRETTGMHSAFRAMYSGSTGYARSMYEVHTVGKRSMSFDAFVKQEASKNNFVLKEMDLFLNTTGRGTAWFKSLSSRDRSRFGNGKGGFITFKEAKKSKALQERIARNLYEPRRGGFRNSASDKQKVELPQFQRDVWGMNTLALSGQRAASSVSGIYEQTMKHRLAWEMAESLGKRESKTIVTALDAKAAARSFGVADASVVRYMGTGADDFIQVKPGSIDDGLLNKWITKEQAARLQPFSKTIRSQDDAWFDVLLNSKSPNAFTKWFGYGGKGTAHAQGTIKGFKTVWNPIAHGRNFKGAAQSFLGSGNAYKSAKFITTNMRTAEGRQIMRDTWEVGSKLGLKGTSVDMGQIFTRLGRAEADAPGAMEMLLSLGTAKWLSAPLAKIYGGTDDVFKAVVFFGETQFQKDLAESMGRVDYHRYLTMNGVDPLAKGAGAELAARTTMNLMPVYPRVPEAVEAARGIPVVGNFSAFILESFRNQFNILKVGAKEVEMGQRLNSAALVASGNVRIASGVAVAARPYAWAHKVNSDNDNLRLVESLREFVPEWHQDAALIVTGVNKEAGEIEVEDASYTSPFQPSTKVLAGIMSALDQRNTPADDIIKDAVFGALEDSYGFLFDKSLVGNAGQAAYQAMFGESDYEKTKGYRDFIKTVAPAITMQGLTVAKDMGVYRNTPWNEFEEAIWPTFGGELRAAPRKDVGGIISDMGGNWAVTSKSKVNLYTSTKFAAGRITRNANDDWRAMSGDTKKALQDPNRFVDKAEILAGYEESMGLQFEAQKAMHSLFTDLGNIVGKTKARDIIFDPRLTSVGSKKTKAALLRDDPRSDLKTLTSGSSATSFWKDVTRTVAGKEALRSGIMQEMKKIDSRYNNKSIYINPKGSDNEE